MFDALVVEIEKQLAQLQSDSRVILGIAGIPGAGKSTLAERLVKAINSRSITGEIAIVVPMDGFHLDNTTLKKIDLLHLKGVPASFDAKSFVVLLKELRTNCVNPVAAPLFDRSIEASIAAGIIIEPRHKLCVVEGNYLLLEQEPWNEARKYFDEIWFLDVDIDTVFPRLLARHLLARSEADGREKIDSTDLPNARLILDTKSAADKIVTVQ